MSSAVRQRKGRYPRPSDLGGTDPIDEADQEEIAKKLEEEAAAQMKEISNIFGALCVVATIFCLGFALVLASDRLEMIHGLVASGLHFAAMKYSTRIASPYYHDILVVVVAVVPVMLLFTTTDESDFHWSMSLANLLTSGVAVFLRLENRSTSKAIRDLHDAKYQYKSL